MLTAVDHIVVSVSDLRRAVETYRSLGFSLAHRDQVVYAVFGDLYLEFRAFDSAENEAEGLAGIALRSDDLDADVTCIESHGIHVDGPFDDPIDGPGGSLSRRIAAIDADTPITLVEHHHDHQERRTFLGGAARHPNTATVLERTYIAVESIERELSRFEQVLGVSAPEPELGTVIMSLMSVFYLGEVGIAVAEPRGPGPTQDALSANGPGMFQVLFRAEHLDVAERLMVDNGMPAPARGTRLSGESAMLVAPELACNVYVALAGHP